MLADRTLNQSIIQEIGMSGTYGFETARSTANTDNNTSGGGATGMSAELSLKQKDSSTTGLRS